MSRYQLLPECAPRNPRLSLPRRFPRAPSALIECIKGSQVPEGGWTQQTFNTPNGQRLVSDFMVAQRVAVSGGMRVLVPKLSRFFRQQGEAIITLFTRLYHNHVGARKEATYEVDIPVGVHGSLWASAIDQVLREQGLEFESIMTSSIQSTADTARNSTLGLLGVGRSAMGQARNNQRVRGMAAKVTAINETTRARLHKELEKGIFKDDLTVADMVKRLRKKFPEIAAGRIPTIARTEMGRAADEGRKQGLKESGVVKFVSVVGCEAREPGSPTYRGESTCNIENVPIGDVDQLDFHINHTGTIIASAFQELTARPDVPGNTVDNDTPLAQDSGVRPQEAALPPPQDSLPPAPLTSLPARLLSGDLPGDANFVPVNPGTSLFATTKELDNWWTEYENAFMVNQMVGGQPPMVGQSKLTGAKVTQMDLDKAKEAAWKMAKLTTKKTTKKSVFRGMVFAETGPDPAQLFEVDQVVAFGRYTSFAKDLELAQVYTDGQFIGEASDAGVKVIVEIYDHAGVRGHISTAEGVTQGAEIIVSNKAEYKVLSSRYTDDAKKHLRVILVPSPAP
jgi:hypothetical protein